MKDWSRLKKVVVISAVSIGGLGVIGAVNSPTQQNVIPVKEPSVSTPKVQSDNTEKTQPVVQVPVVSTPAPVTTPTPTPEPVKSSNHDCPNGTYVNTAGNTVCSPYSSPTTPAGATAQCVDGTYSFSQSHRGTCSHHGGVSQWL